VRFWAQGAGDKDVGDGLAGFVVTGNGIFEALFLGCKNRDILGKFANVRKMVKI
jgi:hypothetical protein